MSFWWDQKKKSFKEKKAINYSFAPQILQRHISFQKLAIWKCNTISIDKSISFSLDFFSKPSMLLSDPKMFSYHIAHTVQE
jgi:hypothetical protein